jgi:hypothetical protein
MNRSRLRYCYDSDDEDHVDHHNIIADAKIKKKKRKATEKVLLYYIA